MKTRKLYRQLTKMVVAAALFLCPAIAPGEKISYQYDDMGRLTQVTYGNGTVMTYTYDEVGNRQQKTTVRQTGGVDPQADRDDSAGTPQEVFPGE